MTHDEARILLEAIQEARFKGSKWEDDFIVSIEGWVEDEKKITEKQSKWLQDIYRKAMGG